MRLKNHCFALVLLICAHHAIAESNPCLNGWSSTTSFAEPECIDERRASGTQRVGKHFNAPLGASTQAEQGGSWRPKLSLAHSMNYRGNPETCRGSVKDSSDIDAHVLEKFGYCGNRSKSKMTPTLFQSEFGHGHAMRDPLGHTENEITETIKTDTQSKRIPVTVYSLETRKSKPCSKSLHADDSVRRSSSRCAFISRRAAKHASKSRQPTSCLQFIHAYVHRGVKITSAMLVSRIAEVKIGEFFGEVIQNSGKYFVISDRDTRRHAIVVIENKTIVFNGPELAVGKKIFGFGTQTNAIEVPLVAGRAERVAIISARCIGSK